MRRTARTLVIPLVAMLLATLALPAAVAASAPSGATLTMLDAACGAAPGTVAVGDTVCARAVVTVTGTGAGEYRTHWYAPGALNPTFADVHALSGAGTFTFQDSHQLNTSGVWTVRACRLATCASAASILASRAFNVSGTVAASPTSLAVTPASGTYAGTTTLSATLVTTSGGLPILNATIAFTFGGSPPGSASPAATGAAAR